MQIANIACYSISDFINIIGLPKLSKSTKYRNHKSNAIEMTGLISTGLSCISLRISDSVCNITYASN